MGIQANQKAQDKEGQEESRVQWERASGGEVDEALMEAILAVMEVKLRIGARMPRERVGVKEVKRGIGKEEWTSTLESTARKPETLNQKAGLWSVEETPFRKET